MMEPRPVASLTFDLEAASNLCAIASTLAQLPEYLDGLQKAFPASNPPPVQVVDILREFPKDRLKDHAELLASFAHLILDDMLGR